MVIIGKARTREGAIAHFKQRMFTRYGFDLTDDDVEEVVRKIQDGESEFVESQSGRDKVHIVKIYGKNTNIGDDAEYIELPVIYDTKLSTVVTVGRFLTKENKEEWIWH